MILHSLANPPSQEENPASKKYTAHLLFIVFTLVVLGGARAQSRAELGFPFIKNYETRSFGIPYIWTVMQDSSGIINFGLFENGVVQYDGRTWQNIGPHRTVYDLATDSNGRLFVACNNDLGYITYEKNGKPVFKSIKAQHLPNEDVGEVWTVITSKDKVYFQTYKLIIEYDPVKDNIQTYKANPGKRFPSGFIFDNVFYTTVGDEGMMMIKNGKFMPAPNQEYFKKRSDLRSIMDYGANEKLILTRSNGLIRYDPKSDSEPIPLNVSNPEFLQSSIYAGTATADNYFLIGSNASGAMLIDSKGEARNFFNDSNTLQGNSVLYLSTDRSKNLWFGLTTGLSRAEHGLDLSYWNKSNGLKGNVFDVHRYKGSIYVATDENAYIVEKDGSISPIKGLPAGIQNWKFAEFKLGKQARFLLGTQVGIFEIVDRQAIQITKGFHCTVLQQSKMDSTRLYATSEPSLTSLRLINGKWVQEGEWKGVASDFIEMAEETDGTLWLGSLNKGVIRVVPDFDNITQSKSVTYFTEKDGLPSLFGCRPFLHEGKAVVGTPKGLFQYDEGKKKLVPYCKLGNQFCSGAAAVLLVKEMPNDEWFITPSSNKSSDVGFLKKEGNNLQWNYRPFRRLPEIGSVFSSWVDDDGVAWLGTSDGLFKYDRNADTKNYNASFKALIRKVSVAKDSVIYWGPSNGTQPVTQLDFEQGNIRFEFAAPFFDREEATKFSYQLVGSEKEFSTWKTESMKEYTNLPDGHYTFQVKAKNIYDKESSIASFEFTILAPWYRSWLAYFFYFVVFALIVLGILRLRTEQLISRTKKLKAIVLDRTRELTFKNEELEASEEELRQNNEELTVILEHLKTTQNQLVQSEKMASLGQLTAGIAHEINNPLNYISGGIQALAGLHKNIFDKVKTEDLQETKQDVGMLMDAISIGVDRATSIVKGLRTFSSPHENEKVDIDIKDVVNSTLLLLNSKLQDANVDLQTQFNHMSTMMANASQMGQVILNIVDNAIQALEQRSDERNIWITTSETESKIMISIKDNGIGIPAEIQGQILNPFFTTKEVGKGTGLGLSISYGIIQKHNGTLAISSELGKGTEFIITLPKTS